MICERICPDYRVKSIYDISPKWLKRNGFTKIVVDLDNTLLPTDKTIVGPRAMTWIRQMAQGGINIALISNNAGDRVKKITKQTQLPIIMRAMKPLPQAYKEIEKAFGGGKILFIGDQLFTDILGAKRRGHTTVWVQSLGGKEHWMTRITRKLEAYYIDKLIEKGMMPKERTL